MTGGVRKMRGRGISTRCTCALTCLAARSLLNSRLNSCLKREPKNTYTYMLTPAQIQSDSVFPQLTNKHTVRTGRLLHKVRTRVQCGEEYAEWLQIRVEDAGPLECERRHDLERERRQFAYRVTEQNHDADARQFVRRLL